MQSNYSSRSLFGCARISLIGAALFVALLPLKGIAQQIGDSQQLGSPPESPGMVEHAGTPSPLRELVEEAEQKNPQIAASFHPWHPSRNVPNPASPLPP